MAKEKKIIEAKEVPEKKKKALQEIVSLAGKNSTLLISSAQNIPSAQLQKIRDKLKKQAFMKLVKKQIMIKAIEEIAKTNKGIVGIKDYVTENSLLLFSDLSAFELAGMLSENRIAKKAKAGQTSPADINIEPGPTDMPAGPMISELSAVGLKVAIENGKIAIKQPHTIVKKDQKISEAVASTLIKLSIFPFTIGLECLAAYDKKNDKVYIAIKINREETEKSIKDCAYSAKALALSIAYPCSEVISLLIGKASMEARALEALAPKAAVETVAETPAVQPTQ